MDLKIARMILQCVSHSFLQPIHNACARESRQGISDEVLKCTSGMSRHEKIACTPERTIKFRVLVGFTLQGQSSRREVVPSSHSTTVFSFLLPASARQIFGPVRVATPAGHICV